MKKVFILSLLASTSMAILSQPAFAQNTAADEATSSQSDDVIIVNARLREERLVDVPVPVSVATKEQLERDQVRNISDLQRVTPALEISQTSGGENNGGARLRGLGTGVFNASVSPSVAFVVDQVPQGNLSFPMLFDLAQVEVLRGPQGTLFGQGASAGVVNISTVNPSTSGISVSGGIDYADKGTAGSEVGEMVVRGAFNLPMGDSAAIRIATQYKTETGLQRNTFLKLDNKVKEFGIRAKALLMPSDRFTVNISGEYSQNKTRGWNFFSIAVVPNATNIVDPDGPGPAPSLPVNIFSNGDFGDPAGCNIPAINARAEFYCEDTQAQFATYAGGMSLRADWEVSDEVKLTSVTAYRQIDRETVSVNFSRRLGVAARNENLQTNASQFSQELRLGYTGDKLDLIVGALYSDFNLKTTPLNNSLPFGSPFPGQRTGFSVCLNAGFFCVVPTNFGFEDTKNNTKAVFADATFSITDQLDIFGGIRYSDYKNTTGVGIDTRTATRSSTINDKNVSGRIGVSFKPSPESTLFGSYAKGYKPPAIVVPTIATDPVTNLRPETADAFEVGAKFELGKIQLSANAFYTNVKDFQIQSSVFNQAGALISQTSNISHIKSKGFEVNAFGRITDFFSLNAGYQFNDVKFPTGFVGDDGLALGGSQFLNAPKHKLTLSGDLSLPVGNTLEAFINANVVYKSKVLLAQRGDPRYRFPSHELVNGRIGVRDAAGKWTASLFVRNLTKQREPTAYLASDFAGNSDGGIRAWPVAGLTARVVGASVGFDF
jgi:iron complex outermembrane recepter protein